MKKLIIIACLNFLGIVASDKYPHLSRHLATESLVRKQCEHNDTARWGTKEIAASCKKLEEAFPLLVKRMDHNTPAWAKTSLDKMSVDFLLAKRDWIRECLLTKKNLGLIRNDIEIIVNPLDASETDIRNEIDLLKGYFLMAAECQE